MKITKTSKQVQSEKLEREIANKGCEKCPCCGETKIYNWFEDNYSCGIEQLMPVEVHEEKLFFPRIYIVDMYRCCTCGAEWQSDPYNQYL